MCISYSFVILLALYIDFFFINLVFYSGLTINCIAMDQLADQLNEMWQTRIVSEALRVVHRFWRVQYKGGEVKYC